MSKFSDNRLRVSTTARVADGIVMPADWFAYRLISGFPRAPYMKERIMLDTHALNVLLDRYGIPPEARTHIHCLRRSQPSRNVGSGKKNVICRFASRKMGRSIQAESHTNELAAVWLWEFDPKIYEFWDQPPPVNLRITRHDGKVCGQLKTADYFVLGEQFLGWVECKTREELERIVAEGNLNYQFGDDQRWHYLPGEEFAAARGLGYVVRLADENNPTLVDNLKFLADYLSGDAPEIPEDARQAVLARLTTPGWMRLSDLLGAESHLSPDHIYALIADRTLYFDPERDRLSEPERTYIFRDRDAAEAYGLFLRTEAEPLPLDLTMIDLSPGKRIVWDGVVWTIMNAGATELFLVDEKQHSITLTTKTVYQMVGAGKVLADPEAPDARSQRAAERLRHASEAERRQAVARYQALFPAPDEPHLSVPPRTLRLWRAEYRKGQKIYGNGFLGLLPRIHQRGNRTRRLQETVIEIVRQVVETRYLTGEAGTIKRAWGTARLQCQAAGLAPPSERTFSREIKRLVNKVDQVRAREGDKAAYHIEQWVWSLDESTPRHGQRPFELGHIDHTEIDLQLVDPRFERRTRKCWVTAMIDAFSRLVLAVYVTFDDPSYRSDMAVIRECVRRHGRIPDTVITDWGIDFRSEYFEELLAFLGSHKKHRPKGAPRHGALIERLFKRMNQDFVHQLRGNNKALQNPRSLSASHDPRKRAVWTIANFTEAFEEYLYEVYAQQIHETLGVSPQHAFDIGMRDFGERAHQRIAFDETFRMMCLPSTKGKTAKVQPGGRVKINGIHYHAPVLNTPGLARIGIRYDPFDMSRAYAFVQGGWAELRSEHANIFCRYTERQIIAASAEIREKNRSVYRNRQINAEILAHFLLAKEQTEAVELAEQAIDRAKQKASQESPAPAPSKPQPTSSAPDVEKDPFADLEIIDFGEFE